MIRRLATVLLLSVAFSTVFLRGMDPPHNGAKNIQCLNCHQLHNAPGGSLTTVAGNANLCISCHVTGGLGSGTGNVFAFTPADQAVPTTGLPVGGTAAGTSHRWDGSIAGRISFQGGAAVASTGKVASLTPYTGPYAKTYTITITTAGMVGAARFSWTTSLVGATPVTNVATGTAVSLDQGVSVAFTDGAAGISFQVGDKWYLYVRPDLVTPTHAELKLENGQMKCGTCHDQHSQANQPFDPNASATYVAGLSADRHLQRMVNDQSQMCVDCHAPRNVTAVGGTSHPVAVSLPGNADYKSPTVAPLDRTANKVRCQSCHDVHKAPVANGLLLRAETAANALCSDCHTYATAVTKGVHFDATLGVLWPGGQYGSVLSSYPAIADTTMRGSCANCHATHGWVDARNTTTKYPHILVDDPSNLCLACHDGTPQGAAPNVQQEIVKTNHHPIERSSGRMIACADCHNPHKALKGSHTYATTATSTRDLVSNVLKGVSGVIPTWGGMWAAPASYTATTSATAEYQICLKCHTSYDSYGTTRPGGITSFYSTGTAKFTSNGTSVAGTGTTWTTTMIGMYIQKNVASPAYRITAASATSLTITPAYAGATDATAAAYKITRQQTDLAVEFNPANRSGHPVATGLNNYTGSTAPKALSTATMKAPWNTNVGTQTMMCSDCHNTDGTAAQGPHGSANPFMLKGANAGNWPNVTLTNGGTSWCANCHTMTRSNNSVHNEGNHSGRYCYNCHVVVPHGSKRSRLIGDHTNMPARYAYNNDLNNLQITEYRKLSPGSYQENSCAVASCYGGHNVVDFGSGNEAW